MSVLQLFTNNAVSLLDAPLTPTSTTIQVQAGLGALFPQPTLPGEFFLVTLETIAAPFYREIIKISGRTGDVLTVAPGGRAQEGTTAQSWLANDTLVDHRITAETIRQAFLQPVAPPPVPGTAWIYGENTGPTLVEPGWNIPISTATYSQNNRGFKFIVSMVAPSNGLSQTFEVLANVSGNITANTETASFTRYSRIGYNFLGQLSVALTVASNTLELRWQNNEAIDVEVSVTRIQHTA
jgi:hypothetical protein